MSHQEAKKKIPDFIWSWTDPRRWRRRQRLQRESRNGPWHLTSRLLRRGLASTLPVVSRLRPEPTPRRFKAPDEKEAMDGHWLREALFKMAGIKKGGWFLMCRGEQGSSSSAALRCFSFSQEQWEKFLRFHYEWLQAFVNVLLMSKNPTISQLWCSIK